MKLILYTLFLFASLSAYSQNLYFPPSNDTTWERISAAELGWCQDSIISLFDYAEENNSKALIILKGGKIVIEKYFGTFTQDSVWYWASAGKTLTSFLAGLAQQQGFLNINEPSNTYLGEGWTNCTLDQENQITIKNQLKMTTGLDDSENVDCTIDTCLNYLADPDSRWAYHNAPYTLLDQVIENAVGSTLNAYLFSNLSLRTGIYGAYLQLDYNNVFFSNARNFARFGLLCQNNGVWEDDSVMTDQNYFNEMITPSQELNKSYGYLWWLNGQESFMAPQVQFVFNGYLMPDAPEDMYAGIGKYGQYVMVSPSEDMVVIRMGNEPNGLIGLAPTGFGNELWKRILNLDCVTVSVSEPDSKKIMIYPNPGTGNINISGIESDANLTVLNSSGQSICEKQINSHNLDLGLKPGIYILKLQTNNHVSYHKYICQ